jgi:subtilisin family serine protease
LALLATLALLSSTPGNAATPPDLVPIIVTAGDVPESALHALSPPIHVDHVYARLIQGLAPRLPPADLQAIGSAPGVCSVHPDRSVEASLAESVPSVGAPHIWPLEDGDGQAVAGQGIRIAIVDGGVDYSHPALGTYAPQVVTRTLSVVLPIYLPVVARESTL